MTGGTINVNGMNGVNATGCGSGGSILIDTNTFEGSGFIFASGGFSTSFDGTSYGGGGGIFLNCAFVFYLYCRAVNKFNFLF
jgi:hypothetical protein